MRGIHTGGVLAALEIDSRSGDEPPPHIHKREHEVFLVIDGGFTFLAPSGPQYGQPGDIAFLSKCVPHTFKVNGAKSRAFILLSPAGFEDYLAPFSVPAADLEACPAPLALDVPGLIARGRDFGVSFLPPGTDLAKLHGQYAAASQPFLRRRDEGERLNVLGLEVRVKVTAEESGGDLSVFTTVDPPQAGPPMHIHANEDELLYVIEGEYTLCEGDTRRKAGPGDMAYFPRGVAHTYANTGSGPGRLLIATTPGGYEAFFRDVDTLCRAGQAGPDQFLPVAEKHGLIICGPPLAG